MSRATERSAAIDLHPRDAHFTILPGDPRFWHGGDAGRTIVFNALSVMFPLGERFFMESVRAFRDAVADPRLLAQIKGFLRQEATHSREHALYNAALAGQGYEIAALEAKLARRLDFARRLGRQRMLALTCALEHFTAILAAHALDDPRVFENAHTRYRRMWLWHAIEEAEHKGVAFDVYRTVAKGPRAYMLRVTAMAAVSVMFTAFLFGHVGAMIKTLDRPARAAAWRSALRFLFLQPGFFTRNIGAYAAYYRPGFHPWEDDNRAALARIESELQIAGAG